MEINMKKCYKCKIDKEFCNYHKDSRSKDGHQSKCKECKKKWSEERYEKKKDHILKTTREWRFNNAEKTRKYAREWSRNNPKKMKEIRKKTYDKNIERRLEDSKKWKASNKEKVSDYNKKWIKKNRGKKNYLGNKRRAFKLNATPEWANLDKIKVLYEKAKWLEELTGLKYHVDHIIPLQGKNVCGLHIWENLQILEDKLNCSKSNLI